MNKNKQRIARSEKGQALVLIVLAVVVMLGFTALAIDLGMIYSDRRAAQNAADAAAMSAAYTLCKGGNSAEMTAAATNIAATNGFADNTSTTGDMQVTVNNPPLAGQYAGDASHIEVVIKLKRKPIFAQFVYNGPLESTVRAVSYCQQGSSGSTTHPGLGGEISILALSKTASHALSNTGGSGVDVDGGVFVNSTANDALYQQGSAKFLLNWAKVRGGADLAGSFGILSGGSGAISKQIDIVRDIVTSGDGQAITGAFNIGGSVNNTASINLTGNPMNVGGNFTTSGAATVDSSQLLVCGDVTNTAGAKFTSEYMVVGGNIKADGDAKFFPATGKTQTMKVGGSIDLSGSAEIGTNTSDILYVEGLISSSGGSKVNSAKHTTFVPKPGFSVSIPEMDDPLATVLNPPTPPTGSCTNLSIVNYGSLTLPVTSGEYYCNFFIDGSLDAVIPPGTYWVDWFSLGGAAKLKMDGVHLYITGNGVSNAFNVGGSGSISMVGTMLYIKSGAFNFSGASGTLDWTAPGASEAYQGLALYMDRANTAAVSQHASATISSMSGTWYAPASHCSFAGDTSTVVYSQFICDTITVDGSSKLTIRYDSTLVYQVPGATTSPQVSLDE